MEANTRIKNTPKYITKLSQKLRMNMTASEVLLWEQLKLRQLGGYKFRRQFPIGRYIVDFYNHDKKLVIEVDGSIHECQRKYDGNRERLIIAEGYQIIRLTNNEIMSHIENVLDKIRNALAPSGGHLNKKEQ